MRNPFRCAAEAVMSGFGDHPEDREILHAHNRQDDRAFVVRVVRWYVAVSVAWILLTDLLVIDHLEEVIQSSLKGILYTVVSAALLARLMARLLRERRRYNDKFGAIASATNDIILVVNARFEISYCNRALEILTDHPPDKLVGSFPYFIEELNCAATRATLLSSMASQECVRQDWTMRDAQGRRSIIDTVVQRLSDSRYLISGRDVSTIRDVQRRHIEEKEHLTALLHAIPDPVWMKDVGGRYTACNTGLEKILNLSATQIIGHTDEDIHEDAYAAHFSQSDKLAIERRELLVLEEDFRLPDGSTAYFETSKAPVFATDGELLGVVGIARNVTKERVALQEVARSEKRFRTVFEEAKDYLFLTDSRGTINDANEIAMTTFGGRIVGTSLFDLPIDGHAQTQLRQLLRKSDSALVTQHWLCADASEIVVELRIKFIVIDGTTFHLAQAHDITAKLNAEHAAKQQSMLNSAIIESTPTPIAVISERGTVFQDNDAWRHLFQRNALQQRSHLLAHEDNNVFYLLGQEHDSDGSEFLDVLQGLQDVLMDKRKSVSIECEVKNGICDASSWLLFHIVPLRAVNLGALMLVSDISTFKRSQLLEENYRQKVQALAQRRLEIQETERHRLSMDLHDQVGQELAALKMSLFAAKDLAVGTESMQRALRSALGAVDHVTNVVRDIARRLRPPLLDHLGLDAAIKWHIENLSLPEHTKVHYVCHFGSIRLGPEIELTAFRFIQEAVTNAIRHSNATLIEISVSIHNTSLALSVHDDGCGFDVPLYEKRTHIESLGLLGLRERIAGLAGIFNLTSSAGHGTLVTCHIPYC